MPGGGEQLLGELLVHRGRRGEHAGPDVGQPAHLQQALDRAVLAVGAVQHREDDVDPGERGRAPSPGSSTDSPRPAGSPTSATAVPPATSGSRPSTIASGGSPSVQHPAALPGDARPGPPRSAPGRARPARCRRRRRRSRARRCARRRRRRPWSCVCSLIAADPTGRRSDHRVQRGGEVGHQVRGVLDAAGEPDEARAHGVAAPLRPPVDGGVHATEAGRRRHSRAAATSGAPGGLVGQVAGDHPVHPEHLPRGHRVRGVLRPPRPPQAGHGRLVGEQVDDRGGVRGLPGQPQVEGGNRPVGQPGVERARARPVGSRHAQPGRQRRPRSVDRWPRSPAAGRSARSAPSCPQATIRSAPRASGR